MNILSLIFKHVFSGEEVIFVTNFAIFIELVHALTCKIQREIVYILYLEASQGCYGDHWVRVLPRPVSGQQKENTPS